MRGVVLVVLLGLAACNAGDVATPASAASELQGWMEPTGKPPSKAEFAAILAACQDRATRPGSGGPIEACLADYGLRRVE